MSILKNNLPWLLCITSFIPLGIFFSKSWESGFVKINKDGSLKYIPDAQGNIIPDFSRVGYYQGDKPLPSIPVVKTISPSADAQQTIQAAIEEVSAMPLNKDGFRGAILLKKGTYEIPGTLLIRASGIVLRGEGDATKLVATANKQQPLI